MYEAPPPGPPPDWNPATLGRITCATIILLVLAIGVLGLVLYSALAH